MKILLYILIVLLPFVSKAATFSADRIEEACRSYLLQKYPQDCRVEFSTKFEDIEVAVSDVKAIFDEDYSQANNGIKLDFTSNNRLIMSKVYNFKISKEVAIYRAKDYIPAHTNITSAMLIKGSTYVDLGNIDKQINPTGRIVKNPIYKGEALTTENTLPELAVKRGESIVIIASTGAVTIRGVGTAMEDGRVGETIRVKRDNSKKLLIGKINEQGELIVGN